MDATDAHAAGARFHPVSNIFPIMTEAELCDLAADIRANGLREPIWIEPQSDLIIDGRNRFMACRRVGVSPRFQKWDGVGSIVEFALSLNLHRRHLDASQRAMVAAKAAELPKGANQYRVGKLAHAPTGAGIAKALSVSERSVKSGRAVLAKGAPELVEAVERGRVSVSAAAVVAEAPREEQLELVARGEKEILRRAKEIRAEKGEKNRKARIEKLYNLATCNGDLSLETRYPILYVDPPWKYEAGTTDDTREIENHYPTMSFEELTALPVAKVATDDAVLFLWATSPKLFEAMRLICAWGFNYRTCAVWDKEQIGMGYFFRQQHELLLVAERGSVPRPPAAERAASVFRAKRGEHSAKPEKFRKMIESMYPELPRIELFAVGKHDGWATWGNEA